MAQYSSAIGATIAVSACNPILGGLGYFLKWFRRVSKDVPTLKAEIAEALGKSMQRFVFVIDDIDRMAPDEICELFKVISNYSA